jgi:hypothetical protein
LQKKWAMNSFITGLTSTAEKSKNSTGLLKIYTV